ncbi:MAG: type II secretion system F family protein [Candidatus Nanoarchaeia archaeon]|jgi:flagellar protein FlaJ
MVNLLLSTKQWILIVSLIVSILLTIGYFLFLEYNTISIAYLGVIVISVMLFPVSFYEYSVNSKLAIMEEQFPIFLKDLADNLKAGLSISDSVRTVSKNDYRAFNSEVRKLSNQMSWGVSFEKSISDIMKRLKNSVFISRGLAILIQAFKSGGDISPIMNSVADSTLLLQNVQKDQENQMLQQVSIIYMIQLVFIGIIVILFKVLVPITTSGAFSTGLGASVAGIGGASAALSTDYYKGFFFLTMVIQSVCNGFVAGYTKNNNLLSGVRHVAIMLGFSILLFSIFILPRTLNITAASESYSVVKGEPFKVVGTIKYDDLPISSQRVEVILQNASFSGLSTASGEYTINVISPNERGRFDGIARIEYDGQKAETAFTINVR